MWELFEWRCMYWKLNKSCCESCWEYMDLSCIEWEVFGLQGGDELHSLKVRIYWEEVPEVAHCVPEALWWSSWYVVRSGHPVEFLRSLSSLELAWWSFLWWDTNGESWRWQARKSTGQSPARKLIFVFRKRSAEGYLQSAETFPINPNWYIFCLIVKPEKR